MYMWDIFNFIFYNYGLIHFYINAVVFELNTKKGPNNWVYYSLW